MVALGTAGLDWAATAELDEASLERRLMGGGAVLSRVVEPDYARVHIELRRKGVTLMLLWAEYRAAHEGQRTWAYTQFCGHYKAFAKTLKRSMRQQRRAGEKLFIDYAGCQHRSTFPQFRRSKFPHPVAVPVLSR